MTASHAVPPDVISVKVSIRLTLWIALAAAMAVSLSLFYLPWLVGVAVCAVLLPYAWTTLNLHGRLQHAGAITALSCVPSGLCYQLNGGNWLTGKVLAGGLVSQWLTVVRLKDDAAPHRIRYLVLVAGQLSAENYRRLRVHLKWNVKGREKRDVA
jgi:hypothetical protein